MVAYSQHARARLAELRAELTPELKRRVALFFTVSLGIGLVALIVLALLKATYEPFVWAMLVLTGAAYGWFARGELDPVAGYEGVIVVGADNNATDEEN